MNMEENADMGVTITLTYTFNSNAGEEFLASFPETLKATADFDGFRDIKVFRNGQNPRKILYIQRWDSENSYKKYVEWRTERGDLEALSSIISEPPIIEFWPDLAITAVSTKR